MTTEQLLYPRARVAEPYPFSCYKVGDIITDTGMAGYEIIHSNNEENALPFEDLIKNFPKLFCKVEWYEERALEDMPQYVKLIQKPEQGSYWELGAVLRVSQWQIYRKEDYEKYFTGQSRWYCIVGINDTSSHKYNAHCVRPATQEEFNEYLKVK